MITLDFRRDDQRAVLTGTENNSAFRELRLGLGSRSSSIADEALARFSLPWWEFLAARAVLRSVVERFGEELTIEPGAKLGLESANAGLATLEESTKSKPLAPRELSETLRHNGFHRELKPYQARNIALISRFPSAADFSIPGAGKTTEALAFFALRRDKNSRLLVVCPKNAFSAWEEQLPLCLTDNETFVRLTGGHDRIVEILSRLPKYMLIGFRQFSEVQDEITRFLTGSSCFVFIDESHHMKKGEEGVIGDAVLRISHLPVGKLVLSGTPMPQSIQDLVPQVRFLVPARPTTEVNVVSNLDGLFVRTTKRDLKLPPLSHAIRNVPMAPAQAKLYKLAASEVFRQSHGMLSHLQKATLRKFNRSVIRLLQIASNPALLGATSGLADPFVRDAIAEGDSPKIAMACKRARELTGTGSKVIIWSIFVRNVELLASRLADLGAEYIHGGVDAGSEDEEDTRENKLKRFKTDPRCQVLVANPAACSEGISLHTVCHYALYLDRGFNAAQYIQSEERIHRIGLSPNQKTRIEILQCPGTVDEVVQSRLSTKIHRMFAVLKDDSLSGETILELDPDADDFDRDDAAEVLAQLRQRP